MIIIIVIILLAIAATMLIGEVGFGRLRLANIADGVLISSASGLSRNLNQIRAISFGAGGLMTHWVNLQSFLLSKQSICKCAGIPDKLPYKPGDPMFPVWDFIGQPAASGTYLNSLTEIDTLHDDAESTADKAIEDLREGLYNGILGGALIDEPLPFKESEITRDERGRIIAFDYQAYTRRFEQDFPLQKELRELKSKESVWSDANQISYSWNRRYSEATARPGVLETEECRSCNSSSYGNYLKVNLEDVPKSIDIDYQALPLLYFYQKAINHICCEPDGTCFPCCHCIILPSFLVDPFAWITDIDMVGGNSFGVKAKKKMDFRNLPFFAGQPTIEHKNKVRIKGNVWSGYDFGLEE